MATGIVKWFDAETGHGFIMPDDGSEGLFAHASSIWSNGLVALQPNQRVSFDISIGPNGKQAANIAPV